MQLPRNFNSQYSPLLAQLLVAEERRAREEEERAVRDAEKKQTKQRREDLLFQLGSLGPAGFLAGIGKSGADKFWGWLGGSPSAKVGAEAAKQVAAPTLSAPYDLSSSVPFSTDPTGSSLSALPNPASANPLAPSTPTAPTAPANGALATGFGNFLEGFGSLFSGGPTPAGPAGTAGYWALPAAAAAKGIYEIGKAFDGDYYKGQYGIEDVFSLKGPRVVASMFGSGKDPAQRDRDAARSMWQESGFLDDQYRMQLASGKRADIGASDYNLDLGNKQAQDAAGALNPLVSMTLDPSRASSTDKQHTDMVGSLANAAMQGDVMANVRGMYEQAGIKTKDEAIRRINALGDSISADERNAYLAAMDQVFV